MCVGTRAGFCNGVIALELGIASREGGHIYEDVSGTIRANAGDNQMSVAYSINHQGGNVEQIMEDKAGTLTASMNSSGNNKLSVAYSIENHPADSRVNIDESGKVQTLTSRMGTGGGNVPMVMEPVAINQHAQNDRWTLEKENTVQTLPAAMGMGGGHGPLIIEPEKVICLQGNGIDRADTAGCNGKGWKEGTCYTLNTVDRPAICYSKPHYIVRRLTPLECERLQGYEDGWTDIGEYLDSKGKRKKSSDSARYKALGNSIALPPWKWVIKRLCSHYERDATCASLFDGIGGFPCIWEQINGKGSAIWASEIEDFPIAVTKARIE